MCDSNSENCEKPVRRKNLSPRVVLYTRQGCQLCDDAARLLKQHGLVPQLVDIDQDPDMVARYDCCVPVVSFDGKVRFRGRVNEILLRRLLRYQPGDVVVDDPEKA